MIDINSAIRIEKWVQDAVMESTILLNHPKNNPVVCEEVFGPFVSIIPYSSIDEAIQEANDSPYGLQAGLFTNQMDVALKAARDLEVGGVMMNGISNF